jgi:WD40 repeat protein
LVNISYAQDLKISVQSGHSGNVTDMKFSNDNKYLITVAVDKSIIIWDLKSGKQLSKITDHSENITGISIHPNNNMITTCSSNGDVYLHEIPSGTIINNTNIDKSKLSSITFSNNGTEILVGGTELIVLSADSLNIKRAFSEIRNVNHIQNNQDGSLSAISTTSGMVHVMNIASGEDLFRFKGKYGKLHFSNDNKFLYAAGRVGKLKRWSLEGGAFKNFTITTKQIYLSYLDVELNDQFFVGLNKDGFIYVYEHSKGLLRNVIREHKKKPQSISVSYDGKYLAAAGSENKIVLWDLSDSKPISTLAGITSKIADIQFSDDNEKIAIGYQDGLLKVMDLDETPRFISKKFEPTRSKRLFGWNYTVNEIHSIQNDTISLTLGLIRTKKNTSSTIKYGKSYKIAWPINKDEVVVDVYGKNKILNDLNIHGIDKSSIDIINSDSIIIGQTNLINASHTDKITSVAINSKYNFIATGSLDGLIKYWDISTGKQLINFSAFNEQDFIYINTQNEYWATKGALSAISFVYNNVSYAFDQFDMHFNKPQKVLQNLPYIKPTIVHNYNMAYRKRLQKLGYDSIPTLNLENVPSMRVTLKKDIKEGDKIWLHILAKDSLIKLDQLHVIVNGVPEYGKYGKKIIGNTFNGALEIKLNAGENEIQCFVKNKNGIGSLSEFFQASSKEPKSPELYLINIGVSNYKDQKYNLTYANKDAKDINTLFSKYKKINEIHNVVLMDTQVTLDTLQKLSTFLSKTDVDDIVIFSYSGHGMLDSANYYLSTYDMNFEKPSINGYNYESLELLLSNCSSRKKIALIDACHSGELDIYVTNSDGLNIPLTKGVKVFSGDQDRQLQQIFDLSKALFSDLRINNGSTTISAASGIDVAYENPKWKNGAFSFALLQGVNTKSADSNKDGIIMLSELQAFLNVEVPKITNGLQKPTSRTENLVYDFPIWEY